MRKGGRIMLGSHETESWWTLARTEAGHVDARSHVMAGGNRCALSPGAAWTFFFRDVAALTEAGYSFLYTIVHL